MPNKITFGLRNVHYALANFAEDAWTFDTPKTLIGAQEFSSELVGGTSQVYADDKIFHTLVSNSGATITLKLTELSDEFKKDVFGYAEDSNKNLVEVTNADVKTFALGYEIQGDSKARRVWYFLCTATPVGQSTKSKAASIEANSVSLTITARPIEINDREVLRVIAAKGDTNYETFFDKVTLPTIEG